MAATLPSLLGTTLGCASERNCAEASTTGGRDHEEVDSELLNDTTRRIGSQRIASRPDAPVRSIVIGRHYDADISDVWEAITEPGRLNRWFIQISGDLREGGTFQLEGNAGGTILRCDPPNVLRVTWAYGDRTPDEVELRLTSTDGGTDVELEHAVANETVEMDGRILSIFRNDPETGIWGVPTGWETPLTFSLTAYLAGELPDVPASEWYEPGPEDIAIAADIDRAWAEVVG